MPKYSGIWGQEWDNCDRCGFVHPIGMLSMQLGLKLCHCHGCWDDLSNYYRPQTIANKLTDTQEGMSDKPDVFTAPSELTF